MVAGITIQIVGWNSEKHLQRAVKALADITDNHAVVRYIDNGSDDNSVGVVRDALPRADIIQLDSNKGFAHAHNIGLARCTTPYVLTHDPDVVLDWKGVRHILNVMDDNQSVGSAQGLLVRANNTSVVDSAGIALTLAFNGKERGSGKHNAQAHQQHVSVAAVTGACGIYQMDVLRIIAHNSTEIFDEAFFAYKEDVDVGLRIARAGYTNIFVPVHMGTHARTLGKRGSLPWFLNPAEAPARLMSARTRYSIRNYVWLIVKNITWRNGWARAPFIAVRLLFIGIASILFFPLASVWIETFRGIPNMIQKRNE